MSVLVIGMGGVRVNVARRFADEEYKVVCYHIALRRGIDFFRRGKRSGMHKHSVEECFFILRGRGKAMINGNEYELEPDICLYCPTGTPHDFINTSNCESLVLLANFQ